MNHRLYRCATFCLVASMLSGHARAEHLTLAEVLKEVADNNPQIEAARSNVGVALGSRLVFRSRALPNLTGAFEAGQQGDEGTSVTHPGTIKRTEFVGTRVDRGQRLIVIGNALFVQPIFDVGIPASFRRGNAEIAVTTQNFATVACALLNQARLEFYAALFARDYGKVLNELGKRLDNNVNVVQGLFQAGLSNRQTDLQAQVLRAAYNAPIQNEVGSYQTAIASLWQLMGREIKRDSASADPLADLVLDGSLDDAQPPEFDAATIARKALVERPDLQSYREMVHSFAEDARIERANYYPMLQIIVTGQALPQNFVRSDRPNALRAGDEISTTQATFGARYLWTIIDTGQVQGSAQRIDHLREGLEFNLRHLEDQIPRDLAKLKAQSGNLRAQAESFRANIGAANDTLQLVTDGVAKGANSQLEDIDAENGVLNAELGLVNVQYQTCQALAEFDRIAGGYMQWVEEPVARSSSKQNATSAAKDR